MRFVTVTLDECLDIRHEVLWPALSRDESRVDEDETASHFGVLHEGKIVSCLSVFMLDPRRCQIRKFASRNAFQGKGFGGFLFQHVVSQMQSTGIDFISLDARTTASAFYKKYGFICEGAPFHKRGVEYIRMSLNYAAND